ncbi:IS66 family transposase [Oligoflexus tunisiensis]|uniref:IS66 family transposase n=1 Tax=Oligoflexus tunisiensis TaxID=708132 RepID=UPI00159F18BD|nr:IS66 family transposase [Oligoflexus tunisiensis]
MKKYAMSQAEKLHRIIILYQVATSRSSDIPLKIFKGYKGYVQTDGYEGYAQLGFVPGIIHVGDWVHVRRKFKDAIKGQKTGSKATFAKYALSAIKELYRIGNECADAETRLKARQTQSSIINDLRNWLDEALHKVPPKSLTGQALAYMNGQWPKLVRFLDDPVIGLDTNVVENAIRPFASGRKAWLFSDTIKGAAVSAALYSLVITARANGIDPYEYLTHIFSELPKASSTEDIERLLPWNFSHSKKFDRNFLNGPGHGWLLTSNLSSKGLLWRLSADRSSLRVSTIKMDPLTNRISFHKQLFRHSLWKLKTINRCQLVKRLREDLK